MARTPQQVRDAISSGQDQKLYGHSLHLLVRNGRGYWVHRFCASDGKIHSRGVGSAATVTPAAARRDCAAFMTDKRRGTEFELVINARTAKELGWTIRRMWRSGPTACSNDATHKSV